MAGPVIFLDDGGVLNDNRVRGPEWQRLLGEFFPPLLGGTPAAWAEANRLVDEPLLEEELRRIENGVYATHAAYWRSYQVTWLQRMCAAAGVASPPDSACLEVAEGAMAYVTRRVRSAVPGAADAVRLLHAQGYTLHTASSESLAELTGYLEGMGIRGCFGRLYGPDQVFTFKHGPGYYRRIFADAGVNPAAALVVDDSPRAVSWAREAGATAILVSAEAPDPPYTIRALADLPALLETHALRADHGLIPRRRAGATPA